MSWQHISSPLQAILERGNAVMQAESGETVSITTKQANTMVNANVTMQKPTYHRHIKLPVPFLPTFNNQSKGVFYEH